MLVFLCQQMNTDARFNLTAKYPPFGKLNSITMSLYQVLSTLSPRRISAVLSLHVKPLSQLSSNGKTLQDSLCCFYSLWLFI